MIGPAILVVASLAGETVFRALAHTRAVLINVTLLIRASLAGEAIRRAGALAGAVIASSAEQIGASRASEPIVCDSAFALPEEVIAAHGV